MAAKSYHSAAGTGSTQLIDRGTTLLGIEAAETTTSARAELVLRDGSDASAERRGARIHLIAGESTGVWYAPQGVTFTKGVFLERLSGTSEVTIYVQ